MTRVPGDRTPPLFIRAAAPNEIKIKHKMPERGDRRPTDNRQKQSGVKPCCVGAGYNGAGS